MLSLCDGMGGGALSLKADGGWSCHGFTKYVAVEINSTAQKVCKAANPKDGLFPGVEHGLFGKHDIFKIKESDFICLKEEHGPECLKLILASPDCKDHSQLRKLPD